MIELIEKLSRQAKFMAEEDINRQISYNAELKAFAEKFAELIVKECIKESMDEIVADEEIAQEKDPLIQEYLKGNNQGIVDAVVRFRNHFGVEE
jgi:hypothetical protein